jgi:hypothetical protein
MTERLISRRWRGRNRSRPIGSDWEPGFDDVHAHDFEVPGDLDFFRAGKRRAGDCSPSRNVVSKIRTWWSMTSSSEAVG